MTTTTRIHLSILAAMGAIQAVTAQHVNWDMHPGTTSFTSRGDVGRGAGEILQGVHQSTSRGVLEINGKCLITEFNTVSQDQNCSTRERFGWIVRAGTDAAGPGTGAASKIGEILGLSTPTRSGKCAFSITTTLTSSGAISVPSVRHWSYGLHLPPSPNWSTDGHSVHATGSTATNTHRNHFLNEDQAWQIIGTATAATHPSQKRSWRLSVRRVKAAVMKLRSGGRAGYGGSFPVKSSTFARIAWDARLQGGTPASGASSVVAMGLARTLGAGPIGTGANLYITGPYFLFFGPAAGSNGVAVVPLLTFVPASAAGAGTIHLQGLLGTVSLFMLTNSQSVKP